jgi:branched-chain amino acid transport system substrate-binding protein
VQYQVLPNGHPLLLLPVMLPRGYCSKKYFARQSWKGLFPRLSKNNPKAGDKSPAYLFSDRHIWVDILHKLIKGSFYKKDVREETLHMYKKFMAVILLIIITASGCSGANRNHDDIDWQSWVDMNEPPVQTIKIGALGPFSGSQAYVGPEFQAALELAFEPLHYRIGHYSIDLVFIDTGSDADVGREAYEKAIANEKIIASFGEWNTAVSIACMEIAAERRIPHFFALGSSDEIENKVKSNFDQYKYWVGMCWPSASRLVLGYVTALEEAIDNRLWNPAEKTVVIYTGDTAWTESFSAALKNAFLSRGWTVADEIKLSEEQTNFRDVVDGINAVNPAVVAGTISNSATLGNFISALRNGRYTGAIIADGLGWSSNWYELAGEEHSNYVLDQIPFFTGNRAASFISAFNAKAGYDPSPSTGGLYYDLANFLVKVLQSTLEYYGEITSETLMRCAEEYVISGELTYKSGTVHPEYKFTPDTFPEPVVAGGFYMFPVIQYMDGNAHIVWPRESKTETIKFMK